MPLKLPDWANSQEPITLPIITQWCAQNGIHIEENCVFPTSQTTAGLYKHATKTIYVSNRVPTKYLLPTLAHETVHAFYQHDGHQQDRIEQRIDEALAVRLINSADYAYWEQEYGWHTGGIASAIGQPRWLVEAYRRVLAKQNA